MRLISSGLGTSLIFFCGSLIAAETPPIPLAAASAQPVPTGQHSWMSWGGETTFRLNPDIMIDYGIRVVSTDKASAVGEWKPGISYYNVTFPTLTTGALEIDAPNGAIKQLIGGSLQHSGGPVLDLNGTTVDLRGFILRPRAGTRVGMELADSSGKVWFTLDHAHYLFEDNNATFVMKNMNLRVGERAAQAMGKPEAFDIDIGMLDTRSNIFQRAVEEPLATCNDPWPTPGNPTDVLLIRSTVNWTGHADNVSYKRCGLPNGSGGFINGCTAASTNGSVVFDQDSSLRNIGDTSVAWYTKFASPSPPYSNDQHPVLIWNLYRLDANGSVKQVGVSGVKHAFVTVNDACGCSQGPRLYKSCEDTYSTGNNDNSSDLGPRNEMIPATAQWGRCGSIYDVNCDGVKDPGSQAPTLFDMRMRVIESDMLPPLSTNAKYYFEYWYIVRDDMNIYNTMGFREVKPLKSGSTWSMSLATTPTDTVDFTNGPVINLWVNPTSVPAGARTQELASTEGHARVAVKTSQNLDGTYHYEYAVMNFDFARAIIDPAHAAEPNLKVLSNTGFSSFEIPLGAGADITNVAFQDTDLVAANDWASTVDSTKVRWEIPTPAANQLNWGTLYKFSFDSNTAPITANSSLGVANPGTPTSYAVSTLTPDVDPVIDLIFADGFGNDTP